jgi:transposase
MARPQLWEIYRRAAAGQSVSEIAREQGWDRKTVREYLKGLKASGLGAGAPAVSKERFNEIADTLLIESPARASPVRDRLGEHAEELRELINRDKEPLKPKSAYLVIVGKYEVEASYETFKRFARERGLARKEPRRMIRIELPPGKETQLDYGQVGSLLDPVKGAQRRVWAFCGILAHSRLPYIEFVRTQEGTGFSTSVVSMLHEYGGATEWISVDNLKAGVIKPDLWDPTINRSLAEVTAYYGVFVNPCRVGRSTDKGKIERMVPVARELFRMLKELHPSATLNELNEHALHWCREVYGRKEHGSTGVPPMTAFETERSTLKALPQERFQVASWKQASVHPGDQFFSFGKRLFALPPTWRGRTVWVRYAEPLLQVYDDENRMIRQYVVKADVRRYWLPEDFPEEVRPMMDGSYPAWLQEKASGYGEEAVALVRSVLRPHAYLNARRARGMLDVFAAHHGRPYFQEVCQRATRRSVSLPATLRRMMEAAERRPLWQAELPMSEIGTEMVRDIDYYVGAGGQ